MRGMTMITGLILIALGLGGYLVSSSKSFTALIPSLLGVLLLLLGWLAGKAAARKHALHGAILVAIVGIIGASRGIRPFIELLMGGEPERPLAAVVQSLTALFCAVLVVAGIRSFIQARKTS